MTTSNGTSTNHTTLITNDGLNAVLRQHAEQQYAEELAELAKVDTRQRPPNWKLSPWAVRTYLMGGKLENGFGTPRRRYYRRLDAAYPGNSGNGRKCYPLWLELCQIAC